MRNIILSILFISVSLTLVSCNNNLPKEKTTDIPEKTETLKTSPLYIDNCQFKTGEYTVLLRGVNVSGGFKYFDYEHPNKDEYFDEVTEGDFRTIREIWGMNLSRTLVEWYGIEPFENQFNYEYLEEYAKIVSFTTKYDIYTMVDMHQDGYGIGFGDNGAPAWTCSNDYYENYTPIPGWWWLEYIHPYIIACYHQFWTSKNYLWEHYRKSFDILAEKLKDSPMVLGFEIMNEPYWADFGAQTFDKEYLYPFYVTIGNSIRAITPNKLIFFEPAASRNFGLYTSLEKLPYQQTVYSPHYYYTAIDVSDTYNGDNGDGSVEAAVISRVNEGKYLNSATIIGEYGVWAENAEKYPNEAKFLTNLMNVYDKHLVSAAFWEFSFIKKNYNRDTYSYGDIIIRPYPEKWKGKVNSFSYDREKKELTINWIANIGDDMIVSMPIFIYKSKATISSKQNNISWKWINRYQIKIIANSTETAHITISK